MKRKQYTNRKGINPVLFQMSEEQKAATHMRAANKAHKLLTDKVLHDVFGFGPVRRERFRMSMRNSWIWRRKNGRSELT